MKPHTQLLVDDDVTKWRQERWISLLLPPRKTLKMSCLLLLTALDGLVRVIYKNKSSLYLLPLSLCLRVGGHPPFRKKKNLVFVF